MFGEVNLLDAVATSDGETGEIVFFMINRALTESLPLEVHLRALDGIAVTEHIVLSHPDPEAVNSPAAPETVVPRTQSGARIDGQRLAVTLPPLSWNVLRLTTRRSA
jgi:alpha-N-arabinofuranosidase